MARKSKKSGGKKVTLHSIARAIKQTQKQLRVATKGASAGTRRKVSAKVKRLGRMHQMLMKDCGRGSAYQVLPME